MPSTAPASVIAFCAWALLRPASAGIVIGCLPCETCSVTVEPLAAFTPCTGVDETTDPAATVDEYTWSEVATNPRSERADLASPSVEPFTVGTETSEPGPAPKYQPVPPATVPVETVTAPVETPAAILPEAAAPVAAMIETAVEAAETVSETVKAETQTAAADPAPVTPKEVKTMEATIKSMTDKTQAAFADFNTRAKAAVEKSTKLFEDANAFGKGNVEALVASSKVAAKGAETLSQDAAEFGRKSFEEASAVLRSFSEVKSPADFFKLQGDYARSAFDAAVAESARVSEAVLKIAGEVAEPITSRYAVAAERVKTLAA